MSPRRYSMKKRRGSVAETRQRIVEATLKLHGSKGIFGTSWQEIALEADVSLGTVHKHFPSLDELVPACGELLMERVRPPSPDDAEEIIGEAVEPAERLHRIASTLFAFYERGGAHLETDIRERQLPAVREWEQHLKGLVTHLAGKALEGQGLSADQLQMASALLDFPSFRAMRSRDIGLDRAVEDTTAMIMCWLEKTRSREPRQRQDAHRMALREQSREKEMTIESGLVSNPKGAAVPAFVRNERDGIARWWLGSLALIKATGRDTAGQFCLVEIRENEGETPLHVHHNEDETFWVLEGDIEFEVGGERFDARPGTMLFGPRGVPHRYTVRRGPARMLFLFTPAGFEDLLLATSDAAAEMRVPAEGEGLPDFDKLPDVVRRYGCELLG